MSKEQDQEGARRARAREVGLFRYALISDALDPAMSTKQRGRLVRAVAAQSHPGPFGTPLQVSRPSLDCWIRHYGAGGFAALVPAPAHYRRPWRSRSGGYCLRRWLLDSWPSACSRCSSRDTNG